MTYLTAQGLVKAALKNRPFMERTVESHNLYITDLYDATHFLPNRYEESYFAAEDLAKTTSYFERKGILIADGYGDAYKSFEKWLALQKHDVARANSLYAWRQAVETKIYALHDDMYDLEEMATTPAVKGYVAELIARKETECKELSQLRHDLGLAIDKVKGSHKTQRAVA